MRNNLVKVNGNKTTSLKEGLSTTMGIHMKAKLKIGKEKEKEITLTVKGGSLMAVG